MQISKNMSFKAGYQGKHDPMRAMAERLLNHPGHAKDVYPSKSAADRDKIRPYKEGGHVKKCYDSKKHKEHEHMEHKEHEHKKHHEMMKHYEEKKESKYKEGGSVMKEEDMEHRKKGGSMKKDKGCQKFAMGGVAKIRHDEATAQGMPKKMKKTSTRESLYYQ